MPWKQSLNKILEQPTVMGILGITTVRRLALACMRFHPRVGVVLSPLPVSSPALPVSSPSSPRSYVRVPPAAALTRLRPSFHTYPGPDPKKWADVLISAFRKAWEAHGIELAIFDELMEIVSSLKKSLKMQLKRSAKVCVVL